MTYWGYVFTCIGVMDALLIVFGAAERLMNLHDEM